MNFSILTHLDLLSHCINWTRYPSSPLTTSNPPNISSLRPFLHSAMASAPTSTGSTKVDALVQNVAANTPEKLSGLALYSRFALAGAVCCSVTHGGLTPVDV